MEPCGTLARPLWADCQKAFPDVLRYANIEWLSLCVNGPALSCQINCAERSGGRPGGYLIRVEEARDFLGIAHHADEPCEQYQKVEHSVRLLGPRQMPDRDGQYQENLKAHGPPEMELWFRKHALKESLGASIPKRKGSLLLVL